MDGGFAFFTYYRNEDGSKSEESVAEDKIYSAVIMAEGDLPEGVKAEETVTWPASEGETKKVTPVQVPGYDVRPSSAEVYDGTRASFIYERTEKQLYTATIQYVARRHDGTAFWMGPPAEGVVESATISWSPSLEGETITVKPINVPGWMASPASAEVKDGDTVLFVYSESKDEEAAKTRDKTIREYLKQKAKEEGLTFKTPMEYLNWAEDHLDEAKAYADEQAANNPDASEADGENKVI